MGAPFCARCPDCFPHSRKRSSMLRRPALAASLRFTLASLFVSVFLSLCLQAQTGLVHGTLSGTVTDTTSSAIPGSSIELSTSDKTTVRSTTTGPDGAFSVPDLPSGTYSIDITAPGFARYHNESIAIAVGRNSRVDAQLQPERATQQVTVRAQTEAMDTSQSSP